MFTMLLLWRHLSTLLLFRIGAGDVAVPPDADRLDKRKLLRRSHRHDRFETRVIRAIVRRRHLRVDGVAV